MSGVIGIDLGTADAIVASVGRGVVDIVRNEVSERKTPCVVGFTSKNRLIGESAMTSIKSNYKNTCRNPKQLLGRSIDDPELEKEKFFQICDNAIANDGTAGYKVSYLGQNRVLSATVVTSMLLSKLKETADIFTSSNSKDVVIAVPSYFKDCHRQAVLDASRIAGLNCLRVMNDSTATALAYGIYRSNEFNDTKPTIVAFTSVGASHFGTCIVKFTKSHLTIIGEAIDTTVGGRYIDKALMEYYANEFSKKTGGLNPLDNAKSRFKLEEAVNKVKKILSANNEAVLGIECLLEDEDLNAIVTRDKLEELCKPMIDKMVNVMNKALSEANVSKDELDSVEIVGGVSRVPFIQHTIINTFGINDLSRTLNADECVARGCALQAAMLSPLFKVRDFAVTDFIQDGIQVEWKAAASSASVVTDNNNDNTTSEEMGGGDDVKKTEVFQPRSTLNMVKMLTFYRKDPFELSAHYSTTSSSSSSLGKYIIEVPHSDVSKKIKVRAKLSLHGIFSIENAVLLEEEEYTVIEKERRPKQHKKEENEEEDVNMPDASPKIDDNNNQDVNMKQDEGTAEKQQQQQEQEEEDNNKKRDDEYEEVEVTKTKTRTKKTDIPIKRYGVPGMTDEQLDIAENDETKMKSIDKEVSETDEKRNELESYVFESRDKISSPSSKWYDYLSESQRDELSNILMKTEDWIYDNYDASKAEYMDKLIDIRKLGDEADRRLIEASLRPEAEATAQDTIQKYRSLIQSPDKSYISNDSKEYIINECNKLESWLSQHKALQARQALYINPVYTVNELNSKTQSLIKVADGILSQPPPTTSTTPTPTTNNNGSCNPTIDEVDDSSSASDDKDNNNDMDVD